MANQFQQLIHRLSTDGAFRQRFLESPRDVLSAFELSEEEQDVLSDMRRLFVQSTANDGGPNGPWGWQFTSLEAQPSDGGPNGPWGWQFTTLEAHPSDGGPNGPWGWQFAAPQPEPQSS